MISFLEVGRNNSVIIRRKTCLHSFARTNEIIQNTSVGNVGFPIIDGYIETITID